jgi:hypothetical protein
VIVVFVESPDKELPLNNGLLFQMLVRALAKREAQRNSKGWMPIEKQLPLIEKALAKLAFAMIDEDTGTNVSIKYVIHYFGNDVFQAAKSANFLEIDGDSVRFYHQLTKEYFCALELSDGDNIKKVLPNTPISLDQYGVYHQTKWDNSIIALVGLQDKTNAKSFINQLSPINPFLASDCLLSAGNLSLELCDLLTRLLLAEVVYLEQVLPNVAFQIAFNEAVNAVWFRIKGFGEMANPTLEQIYLEWSNSDDKPDPWLAKWLLGK